MNNTVLDWVKILELYDEYHGLNCEELVKAGLAPAGICKGVYHCDPDCCDVSDAVTITTPPGRVIQLWLCYKAQDWFANLKELSTIYEIGDTISP